MKDWLNKSVYEHSIALKNKEYSSYELTQAYLEAIEEKDGIIGAYLTVAAEKAIRDSRAADKKERCSPVSGIPCALKDNICTEGIRTTCASKMLEDYVPPYDASVVEKLKQAGAVILGKLNMDEFAMGSTTENSAFRVTKNPLDTERTPGGSSGGAAAAVAANEASYALGSETGGSIRQPAAFCGLVGLKPTYGAVSRYGLVAYASSLDQIGPITKTVRDNAMIMNIIAGHDNRDATSYKGIMGDLTVGIDKGVKGIRIGVPKEFFFEGLSEDVRKAITDAYKDYEQMGASIVPVSLPSTDMALSAYYIICSSEASSNLARFDGVRYGYRADGYSSMEELYKKSRDEGFGKEVKKRIMLGTFALSSGYYDAYYNKALVVRKKVENDFEMAFKECDVILSPVAPSVAYRLGENKVDPMKVYLADAYTVPENLAGVPALSIRCGTGDGGMPIGMQLIGRKFSEALLYRVAYAFENRGR